MGGGRGPGYPKSRVLTTKHPASPRLRRGDHEIHEQAITASISYSRPRSGVEDPPWRAAGAWLPSGPASPEIVRVEAALAKHTLNPREEARHVIFLALLLGHIDLQPRVRVELEEHVGRLMKPIAICDR